MKNVKFSICDFIRFTTTIHHYSFPWWLVGAERESIYILLQMMLNVSKHAPFPFPFIYLKEVVVVKDR